jgi:PAS domain S-box-containing protein
MDETGTITEWNRQAEKTFGWSRAEAIGRTAETIIPPRLRAAHRAGLRRFLATGHGARSARWIELNAMDATGREFPVEVTITPVRFGDVYSFNAFVHDITERTIARTSSRSPRTRPNPRATPRVSSSRACRTSCGRR